MDSHSEWHPNTQTQWQPNIQVQGQTNTDSAWQYNTQSQCHTNNQSRRHVPTQLRAHPQTQSQFQAPTDSHVPPNTYAQVEPKKMSKKRTHTPRRTWTGPEEEQLLLGLKECVANGLKCDNGFRTGYLAALEQHLNNQFPGTDLKADPRILSKIHVWKKQFSTLSTMMGMSGFGWNDRTCQIVVDSDQVWEAYVRVSMLK